MRGYGLEGESDFLDLTALLIRGALGADTV